MRGAPRRLIERDETRREKEPMGQKVMCLLWGVEPPDGVQLYEDFVHDDSDPDCDGSSTRHVPGLIDLYGEVAGYDNEPEAPFESAVDLVGYVFALPYGQSHRHRGVMDIYDLGVPIGALETYPPYKRALNRAKRSFAKFARWCRKNHGVELGEPSVWLTTIEVA